jgi:hypothetical protein
MTYGFGLTRYAPTGKVQHMDAPLNLYKIKRIGRADWDEYAGFVVCAASPDEARAFAGAKGNDTYLNVPTFTDPSLSELFVIGRAAEGMAPGIVLHDFHAG